MHNTKHLAALFDLDGVIIDTESQYSQIWGAIGSTFRSDIENFSEIIKGQTLTAILSKWFPNKETQNKVVDMLNEYESRMNYTYIAGAEAYLRELRSKGIQTALVTSSNEIKMQNVRRAHEGFDRFFDAIVTAEKITHSKPHPECFLKAAEMLGVEPRNCVVFEDSFNGLAAGRAAEMMVVGLATTNPREAIADKADIIIDNFCDAECRNIFD